MGLPSVDELIKAVTDLPLPAALKYLIGLGILDYAKQGFETLKTIVKSKMDEGKYAFPPKKEEALKLKELYYHPSFRGINALVPNYKYIDLIRTGLLIADYQAKKSPTNNERIRDIKARIRNRPNGYKMLKIVDLPTTPFFKTIQRQLAELKLVGYSDAHIEEKFDEMVEEWHDASMLVTNNDDINTVIKFSETQIGLAKKQFFILGMKGAAFIVNDALKQMLSSQLLQKHCYEYRVTEAEEEEEPKIEVIIFQRLSD